MSTNQPSPEVTKPLKPHCNNEHKLQVQQPKLAPPSKPTVTQLVVFFLLRHMDPIFYKLTQKKPTTAMWGTVTLLTCCHRGLIEHISLQQTAWPPAQLILNSTVNLSAQLQSNWCCSIQKQGGSTFVQWREKGVKVIFLLATKPCIWLNHPQNHTSDPISNPSFFLSLCDFRSYPG